LDLLAESKARITKGLTAEQLRRQDELFGNLSKASAALMRDASGDNRRAVEKAQQELAEWKVELRRTNPRYQQLQYPDPYGVREAQQAARRADAVAVEYCLGDRRSFVWAVGPGVFQMAVLPGRSEIENQVRSLRAIIGRGPSGRLSFEEYQNRASAL